MQVYFGHDDRPVSVVPNPIDRNKTYRFKVGEWARRECSLPTYFVGRVLAESAKAVYVYGRGPSEPMSVCCQCGRKLTHPVSILVGIGPECGGHYWDESVLGPYGMTEEHVERLRQMVRDIRVDGWIPKTQVREMEPTEDEISTPTDHPMLKPREAKPQGEKKKKATLQGNRVVLKMDYDPQLLAKVKTLQNRRCSGPPAWEWSAPVTMETVRLLREWGFTLDPDLQAWLAETLAPLEQGADIKVEGLKGVPYPFQLEGIAFLESRKGRGLIADEMGLGKTIQALGWLQLHPEARPAVVVVPASLKLNWAREANKWMARPDVRILSGTKADRSVVAGNPDLIVINYDILKHWASLLHTLGPKVVVLDECHYIKNRQAQRTKAVRTLCNRVPHLIALSGTPITNRPMEAFQAVNLLAPELFPSFWKYAQRYCGAQHNGFGWDFTGATNTEELHQRLTGSIMIRRLKKDVLKDLPLKVRTVVPLNDLQGLAQYRAEKARLQAWLQELKTQARHNEKAMKQSMAAAMTMFEKLKQAAVKAKMKSVLGWIHDYLETEDKLVIFAHHRVVVEQLMKELAPYSPVKVDGGVTGPNRQAAVDRFQTDPTCRVFVGTEAACEGITLTAANATAFVELWWTPGKHDQAEDRVHRIGQERDSVSAYYLIAEGTIEETIATLLDAKRGVLSKVLDGKEAEDSSLLSELMRRYAEEDAA